jgi:hypothetical protein
MRIQGLLPQIRFVAYSPQNDPREPKKPQTAASSQNPLRASQYNPTNRSKVQRKLRNTTNCTKVQCSHTFFSAGDRDFTTVSSVVSTSKTARSPMSGTVCGSSSGDRGFVYVDDGGGGVMQERPRLAGPCSGVTESHQWAARDQQLQRQPLEDESQTPVPYCAASSRSA